MTAAEHLAAAMLELAIESKRALDRAQTASRPHLDLEWSKRCGEAAATILELRDRLPRPAPVLALEAPGPLPKNT